MTFSMNAVPNGNIERSIDTDRFAVCKAQLIISRLSCFAACSGLEAGARAL
jgi:hypothetical protein